MHAICGRLKKTNVENERHVKEVSAIGRRRVDLHSKYIRNVQTVTECLETKSW